MCVVESRLKILRHDSIHTYPQKLPQTPPKHPNPDRQNHEQTTSRYMNLDPGIGTMLVAMSPAALLILYLWFAIRDQP